MSAPGRVKFDENEFVFFDDFAKVLIAQDDDVILDGDAVLDLQGLRLFVGENAAQESDVETK